MNYCNSLPNLKVILIMSHRRYGGLVLGYYNPETKVTDVSYIDTPKLNIITVPSYELRTVDSKCFT